MDKRLLGRLHHLMDLCQKRDLSQAEQREMDRLQAEWHEEELAHWRRINASVNLPEDHNPWQG